MLIDRSSRVWAMRRDDVVSAQVLQTRAERFSDEAAPRALISGEWLEGSDFARLVDGVAIVPVYGPLMRSFSLWSWSYEEVERDLRLAEAHPKVRQIVLDIDSPGGLASGCGDCAEVIRSLGKPVTAFIGGMAASAAYWLASAAPRIEVGSGAILGSIGSVIEYVDMEPYFEKLGARIIRVVAEQSPNKRLDPESPEGQAELQALVDAAGAAFVAGVSEGRGVTEAEVLDRFGRGLVFDGAEAIARGMADGKSTLSALVAGLAGRGFSTHAVSASAAQETPMDWASLTLAALREHRPDLVTAMETAATQAATAAQTQAVADAAAAERARILGIEDIDDGSHPDLVSAAKADGKTTPEQLAFAIMKAEKNAGSDLLKTRAEADTTAAVPPAAPRTTTGRPTGSIEDQAKAEWDRDGDLRAEFKDNFTSYLAFRKAEASGSARIKRAG